MVFFIVYKRLIFKGIKIAFRIWCIMLILEKFNDLEAQGYEACLLKRIHLNVMIL